MTFKEKLGLNKKRTLSGLFILFFLSSSLIAITPRRAYAAPVPLSPTEKAAAYQAASVLAECSKTQGYRNKEITSSVLNNGLVFNNQLRDWAASVGFLTPGMANSDGLFGCSNGPQVSSALQQLGQKGVDYFVDAGIYIPKPGGDGYTLKSNVEDPDRAKSIEAYFNKKFGFSLNSKLPPASQYFNLKATFDKKCSAGVVTSGTAGREVKIVDGKGAVTTKRYELNRLDVSHRVGFGMDKDGSNDGKMQCDTIVDQMNAFAGVAAIAQKAAVDAGANAATSGSSTSGTDADPADDTSCENRGGVSSWFACPLITLVAESLQWVDEQIQTLMVVNPNYYQTGEGAENLYKAWTAFRNIALALLIAAMMVIVISTALGVGVLDAYTVKKAFPRLIASVIFILLSWWLCVFMIDFFNVIGQGILGVMTSPFGLSGDKTILSLFDTSAGQAAGQGLVALIAGAGLFLVTGAIGILISWIGTALLVMLIAFLVLVARQMFIITLILFAPLAILAWIFPSTSKIWKFWWESFTKVLIMYPMVMALIGAGRIFASVINDQQATPSGEGVTGGSLLLPMAKLAAYVIPYAFIPFTFKAAGGLFGNLAGMANDRSRGGFDRLRKVRQKNAAEIGQRAKVGELARGNNRFSGRLNRIGAGASQNPFTGAGFSSKGKANIERLKSARKEELLKEPGVNSMMMDDDVRGVLLAGAGRADAFLAAKGIAKGTKAYNDTMGSARSIGFTDSSRAAAMDGESTHGKGRNMAAMASVYGTGTDQSAAMNALINDIGTSAGMTNTGTERLRQNTMYQFGSSGRGDLRSKTVAEVMDEKFDTAIIRGMSDQGMTSLAGAEVDRLLTGNPVQQEQAAAQLLAMNESRTSLSEPTIKALDAQLARAGVDPSSSDSIDIQLAKRLASPADLAAYTSAKASLKAAQDVAVRIQAGSPGAVVPDGVKDAIIQANAALTLAQRPITEIAQSARAKSATYSSSLPIQSREQQ